MHRRGKARPSSAGSGPPGTGLLVAFTAGAALGLAASTARRAVAVLKIGSGHPAKQRVLDLACALLQPKYPLRAMSTYLNGFHLYADDAGRPVEATHFCLHLRPGLHQCVIFDRNAPDARLIGIEYIISEQRFRELDEDEQRLWHSHHYETRSGVLFAPGVPTLAEHLYFEDLVATYGKTFHTWQYDRDDFPYGLPQLMMAFTADGQLDENLIVERDRRFGMSSADKRRSRADIAEPDVAPQANGWESGRTVQTTARDVAVAGLPTGDGPQANNA